VVTLNTSPVEHYSKILSFGAARPDVVVTNEDVCQWIDSSDEWIRTRTGISTRHRAGDDTSALDLAVGASREAIERAGIEAEEIDGVIVATVSHPYATPSMAAQLADAVGATPAPAYDISAACAGYCYGIAQADALVRSGAARNVLVVGVEKLSDFIDNSERSISFLLGDGAGAVVVGRSETPGIAPTVWGSDGSRWDTVGMTHSMLELRNRDWANEPVQEGEKLWPTLRQDGPTVFRWAGWQMAKVAQEAIDAAGLAAEDLGAFIPHQANMRIIDQLVKSLKLPESVVVGRDIAEAGNTSAASVPLAAHRLLEEHPELSGRPALQIGFGAGLVYAAQVVILP
jgi:3-oxoacyl-[acyl-carrier-protein] synthase-3